MTEEQLKAKSNAILDKLEESGFDLDDWSIEDAHNNGFTDGYHECQKEHEWHYVKDGKYPKEKQLVMVYRINPLGANIAITNWYDSYKDTRVIAWKEIVLPELKENE